MNTNTAFAHEVQAPSPRIPAENQGKSPQDVLAEFKMGGIKAEVALNELARMGIFAGDALTETLLTLSDGIDAQDDHAAMLRFPPLFRERVIRKSEELVQAGRVDGADGQRLLDLFSDIDAH